VPLTVAAMKPSSARTGVISLRFGLQQSQAQPQVQAVVSIVITPFLLVTQLTR
jgi:hypothetical protein